MCRILLILPLCWCVPCTTALPRGEEPAEAKLKKLADDARARAEAVEVSVAADGRTARAAVHPTPLMKYTDVPRQIEMGGIL